MCRVYGEIEFMIIINKRFFIIYLSFCAIIFAMFPLSSTFLHTPEKKTICLVQILSLIAFRHPPHAITIIIITYDIGYNTRMSIFNTHNHIYYVVLNQLVILVVLVFEMNFQFSK